RLGAPQGVAAAALRAKPLEIEEFFIFDRGDRKGIEELKSCFAAIVPRHARLVDDPLLGLDQIDLRRNGLAGLEQDPCAGFGNVADRAIEIAIAVLIDDPAAE